MGVQVLCVPTCAMCVPGKFGGWWVPRPLPCAQREKIASLPLPLLQGKAAFALSQVYFLSPEPDPRREVAGGDRPGFSGIGRVWHVGKVSLAGDIHPGLCDVTATKGGENLTVVWQGLGWAAQRNPAPRGVGRGSPGCGVHPELIQNSALAGCQRCWGTSARLGCVLGGHGGVTLQCPGFLLPEQLVHVAVNHDRVSASSSVCACSSQLIRHD